MRKTITTLFLALAASIGNLIASDTEVNGIWYDFDSKTKTAAVTYHGADYVSSLSDYAGDIVIPSSVTYGGITYSVTSIGRFAFNTCLDLNSVSIPSSVHTIGYGAFRDCRNMTSCSFSESVTYIDTIAFSGCSGLESFVIPKSINSICLGTFQGCAGLTSVTIPNSVTMIDVDAFAYCTSLKTITIPESVITIKNEAFIWCEGLTAISIPNSVTSLGNMAFYGCSNLASVIIGNSVPVLDAETFYGCSSLTSITIPASVTEIGATAFLRCSALTDIVVDIANPNYCDINGVLFNKDKTAIIQDPIGKTETEYVIPSSVTKIGRNAFYKCTNLLNVTIPKSVTLIDYIAFGQCANLTSITCKAIEPPTLDGSAFGQVSKSIPLYVHAGCVEGYQAADGWKEFTNIQEISQAEEIDVTTLFAEPADNSVVIEWPAVTGATVYIIHIWKGEELICTLSFNEQGQLLTISYEKRAGNGTAKTATQTATGWQYTIGGLDAGTTYQYTVIAKNGDEELFNESKQFTTTVTTAIDEISNDKMRKCENVKIMRDGVLYIERDGELYNAQGARVE